MIESLVREVGRPVEQVGREKLTDEQMGNLISAVGNHPAKAITLLVMRDGNIYPRSDLHRAILFHQGTDMGWKMDRQISFDYCSESLVPIGVVAKETLNSDLSTYGYQITDYGKEVGIPFIGLMLDWAERHNICLQSLWGKTSSSSPSMETILNDEGGKSEFNPPSRKSPIIRLRDAEQFPLRQDFSSDEAKKLNPRPLDRGSFKKRAPGTTLKILYELVTASDLSLRDVDFADRVKESARMVSSHLKRLAESGLINYQAREANKPFSAYKLAISLPTGELPVYIRYKQLTEAVFAVCQQHPDMYLTREDVYKMLPLEIRERRQSKTLLSYISGILGCLKRNKYVESKHFDHKAQSDIFLTPDQRIILTELLEIIDRFQNQNPEIIARGRRLAKDIITDSSRVSAILRKAKEKSPNANSAPWQETMDHLAYLISSHPGATNQELQKLLEQAGKKLSRTSVQTLTVILQEGNRVRATKEGSAKKFYPKDS